jgi:hypothetical protein
MGTSGTGIFDNDLAADVRDDYLAMIAAGQSDSAALTSILRSYRGSVKDDDEGPVFWFALAATQCKYGRLLSRVKAKALAIIDRGGDVYRWSRERDVSRRRKVLEQLKTKLLSKQPRRRTPRNLTDHELTSSVHSPDKLAWASITESEPRSRTPAVVVWVTVARNGPESGVRVLYAPVRIADVRLNWRDDRTLEVFYPDSIAPHDRKDRFNGIDVVFRTLDDICE